MLIGNRLRKLRLEKGLTQKELGDLINVTKVSICCYEMGTRTPTLDTLMELERVFQVDLNYLLGNDKEVTDGKTKGRRVKMATEEIKFIEEIRKYGNIYELIIENPKRCAELVAKKLR